MARHDGSGVAWLRSFPSTVNVHVGDTVSFKMSATRESHTVPFGPSAYTSTIEKGLIQLNPNTSPPTVILNPLAFYPSDPLASALPLTPARTTATDLRTPASSLTKTGTYHFECLLHTGMDGTVKVT